METSRNATDADLGMPQLRDSETGILCRVPDHILPLLLTGEEPARIETFQPGDTIFKEGQDSTFPVYCILSGTFAVSHTVVGGSGQAGGTAFTEEKAPHIIGDVEFFVRGVDPKSHGRGAEKNKTLSTVTCKEEGSALVLPQFLLLALIDLGKDDEAQRDKAWGVAQFMYNLARAVSIKLLRRGVESEKARMSARQATILVIRRMAMEEGGITENDPNSADAYLPLRIRQPFGRKDMAVEIGYTVEAVRLKMMGLESIASFLWKGNTIQMSPEFLEQLISNPEQLFGEETDQQKKIPSKPLDTKRP